MQRRYRSRKQYSEHAMEVIALAERMKIRVFSDPDWAEAEAAGIETPIGEVHLHWMNHRGRGHWNIVTQPRSHVCKTVRCRKVTITPLGGENESCILGKQTFDDVMNSWYNNKSLDNWMSYDIKATKQRPFTRQTPVSRLLEMP